MDVGGCKQTKHFAYPDTPTVEAEIEAVAAEEEPLWLSGGGLCFRRQIPMSNNNNNNSNRTSCACQETCWFGNLVQRNTQQAEGWNWNLVLFYSRLLVLSTDQLSVFQLFVPIE